MAGLIEQYSSDNRVVEEELGITYTMARVYGAWVYVSGTVTTTYSSMWSYIRTATKHYKYVGMTKDAAESCATDIRTIYARTVRVSEWDPASTGTNEFHDIDGGIMPMASVVVRHVAGNMWEVDISVSETDTRLRRTPVGSIPQLFSAENDRDYDEE